jgi:hypothetical protein
MRDTTELAATSFGRRALLKGSLGLGAVVLTAGGASSALTGVAQAAGGLQDQWAYCAKCRGLFFSGSNGYTSVCPGGGQHNGADSYDYSLYHDVSDPRAQTGWRWCSNCQGLFYGPQQSSSWCPAGGQHVIGVNGFNYDVFLTGKLGGSTTDYQLEWRWCRNCRGLFYGPKQYESICPFNGGTHDSTGSDDYAM